MTIRSAKQLDVAVIGGGPAGVSAALELAKLSNLNVALFESEATVGGIPRTCHNYGFGMRDRKRMYTGVRYARELSGSIQKTKVDVRTQSTVLNLVPGGRDQLHSIDVSSPRGVNSYESRFIILATGCFESSQPERILSGSRPAGVFTTGALQELVNLQGKKPGKRAVVIGSEHVALSSILTLRHASVSIAGIVEEDEELHTYKSLAGAMSSFFGFPVYKGAAIKEILGEKRVEGVELEDRSTGKIVRVSCDTIILTGKFRSYSPLIDGTSIERDPFTFGPSVDMDLMTSVPNIYSAGNVLRGAIMHDLCALEGRQAARNIVNTLRSNQADAAGGIRLRAEPPIRYVVPQTIVRRPKKVRGLSRLHPGFSIQLAHTMENPFIEAWSGAEIVWSKSFLRVIGNTRIPLPVHDFKWDRVNGEKGITLRIRT